MENNPSSESGIYEIDPDGTGGNQPFEVYCDMIHEGGGWTLYAHHAESELKDKTLTNFQN